MDVALPPSSTSTTTTLSVKPIKTPTQISNFFPITIKFPKNKPTNFFTLSSTSNFSISSVISSTSTFTSPSTTAAAAQHRHWMVIMEPPPQGVVNSKPDIINYYVKTLDRVLHSQKDAQMCIYDASCDTHFGFSCDLDEDTSRELAGVPGVLSVRPDPDFSSVEKDYSYPKGKLSQLSKTSTGSSLLFPLGNTKHWLIGMEKPFGVTTKAQMVDYCTQILTKVMGNERDAQMCIYQVSWQSNFGFCCELDDKCAGELAGVPGVLSVQPDENFNSGENPHQVMESSASSPEIEPANIDTKKLFVTGLSFYTSEKTLRAAFEGFGELVEVKIIMDKISKRSKGYAFIEYTTEEAASSALKEMNGKIINGWMIVVDSAKKTPAINSRGRPRPREHSKISR